MRDLTEPQRKVMDYLVEYLLDYQRSPTQAEIKMHMGYSSDNSVTSLLLALEKKRFVKVNKGKHRGIEVLCQP